MKKIMISMAILSLAFFVSACSSSSSNGGSGDTVELKLGTKMPGDSPEGKGFEIFADLVDEKSDGELEINLYPNEQLGEGTTQIDNMLSGTQDMYADGAAYFDDFDSRLAVSSVPYLFKDFDHFQKFNTGEMGQDIQEELISQGVRFINDERTFVRGPYRVLVSDEPIESVEDLEGLKIRSFESEYYSDAYKSVGANPTVIAWTETYLGLQQGQVDAATSPIAQVWPMKFTEVAPYMTVIDEYPQDIVIAMDEDKYQELSDEHKEILTEAANEAGEKASEELEDTVEEHMEKMKEEHDIEVFEIDDEKWSEAFSDYHYQLEEDGTVPEGYIDDIKSIE